MSWRTASRAIIGGMLLLSLGLGCSKKTAPPEAERTSKSGTPAPPELPSVLVAYGSEKKAWLEDEIQRFNAQNAKLPSGGRFSVVGKAMGSGEAATEILEGRLQPAVFSPASEAYISLLNEAWLTKPDHREPIAPAGEPVVISPVVVAMWKPMAEALGWPTKPLGWSDVLRMSRESRGWEALGRAEWGQFKLGHTHPEYSSSGLLAVLAEAYAGSGQTRGLDASTIGSKPVRDFVEGIEHSIVHYGKSTGFFAEKMIQRGPSYLSAAVLYENSVVESHTRNNPNGMPLVAIYPREGTFWSDHPYSILNAPWVRPEHKGGAGAFLTHLKTRAAQERALALGLRPADPKVPIGSPIDAAHGCDPRQPQTLLEIPRAEAMRKLLEIFRDLKKPSDVTLVFDKSGSMAGAALAEAKAGATAFLQALQPRDEVSILFFDGRTYPIIGPLSVGKARNDLIARVAGVTASGGTALYEAIASAYKSMRARAERDRGKIHALVVMTDGKDENSKLTLDQLKQSFPREEQEAPVKLFTISYGANTSGEVLSQVAEAGDGSHSEGTVTNIVQVYRDIASYF